MSTAATSPASAGILPLLNTADLMRSVPQTDRMRIGAKEALDVLNNHAARNRSLSASSTALYRKDMEQGLWHETAQPLIFNTEGKLIDGQHRLMALALAGSSVGELVFAVSRGADPSSILYVDQGHKRTSGQQLSLLGLSSSKEVAAGARLAMAFESTSNFNTVSNTVRTSAAQVQNWVKNNRVRVDEVAELGTLLGKVSMTKGTAMGLAMILWPVDSTAMLEFFTALAEGGEPKNSPITLLDKRLAMLSRSTKRFSQFEVVSLTLTAWNAWRDGRTLTRLTVKSGAGAQRPH